MEDAIFNKLYLLEESFLEDPDKYVSASIIGFDCAKRTQSMSFLEELEKAGFIEILSQKTQVPYIRLTRKGFLKTRQ